MTLGRLWWLMRRDFKRGLKASYNSYLVLSQIEKWKSSAQKEAAVPLRLLTSNEDYKLAAWTIASLEHYSQLRWPIYFHDDGTLTKEAIKWLSKIFPDATIIERGDATDKVAKEMAVRPYCNSYRDRHALGLKIFDMAILSKEPRFLILDSDVLFFREPKEIVNWAAQDDGGNWFNEDVSEASVISAQEAQNKLNLRLWPRVNSGICLIQKKAIDLDFCETCFTETALNRGKLWRIEQTLFAACASRWKEGGILPKNYEVTLKPNSSAEITARHYVGAVRDRFYGEGLPRLKKELLR